MKKSRPVKKKAQEDFLRGTVLLIAAGGTGGHITPGISIAETWLARGGRIVIATLTKNIDYPDIVRLARDERVSIVAYDAPRLTKNPLETVSFLRRFRAAYRLVAHAARQEQVAAVLGMGGYSSFPAVLFAMLNRLPLYLCEQNARWGIVTRAAKRFARRVFLSFAPETAPGKKFFVTGNPIRAMFTSREQTKPAGQKKAKAGKKRILFLGGSQGAGDLNQLYLEFTGRADAGSYQCTVAAGKNAHGEIAARARKGDTILPFIEDMATAYEEADTIVARCGSGTLFEIVWSGKPAFLIPYPFATANHQRANADGLKDKIPCTISDHRPFDARRAADELIEFLTRLPQLPPRPVEPAAEQQIVRYLEQDLMHA